MHEATIICSGLGGHRANAAHIVRCVNAHDELVAALQSMIVAHRKLAGPAETEVVDRAIAALAKVQP
jgi:hypothetical protein